MTVGSRLLGWLFEPMPLARVAVLDLADGRTVRTLATGGMQLVGAAGDAHVTAIVLSTGGAFDTRSRLVLLDARDALERPRVEAAGLTLIAIGQPDQVPPAG